MWGIENKFANLDSSNMLFGNITIEKCCWGILRSKGVVEKDCREMLSGNVGGFGVEVIDLALKSGLRQV